MCNASWKCNMAALTTSQHVESRHPAMPSPVLLPRGTRKQSVCKGVPLRGSSVGYKEVGRALKNQRNGSISDMHIQYTSCFMHIHAHLLRFMEHIQVGNTMGKGEQE